MSRRRVIQKERADGIIEDEQRRTRLGLTEPARQHLQRKVELQQGIAGHGGGDADERVRQPARRAASKRPKQIRKRQNVSTKVPTRD